jgi:hypothetical protein
MTACDDQGAMVTRFILNRTKIWIILNRFQKKEGTKWWAEAIRVEMGKSGEIFGPDTE